MYSGLNNSSYSISSEIRKGGEGTIYNILNNGGHVAKIYHAEVLRARGDDLETKLTYMVKNPPGKVDNKIAWPQDVLYENGRFCGFTMKKIAGFEDLLFIYSYPTDNKNKGFTTRHRVTVAWNLCSLVKAVHDAGYIVGDFNPSNIACDKQCHIAFFDVDSYHVNENGRIHKCEVACDGYVAPEILDKYHQKKRSSVGRDITYSDLDEPTFTKNTDRFALGIHIFRLLMNGFSPYCGVKKSDSRKAATAGHSRTPSASAPLLRDNAAVEADAYCFRSGLVPQTLAIPDKNTLPRDILDLFAKTFKRSEDRPSPEEWMHALDNFMGTLTDCNAKSVFNPSWPSYHNYMFGLASCPYCKADEGVHEDINRPAPVPNFTNQGSRWTDPQTPMPPPITGVSPLRLPDLPFLHIAVWLVGAGVSVYYIMLGMNGTIHHDFIDNWIIAVVLGGIPLLGCIGFLIVNFEYPDDEFIVFGPAFAGLGALVSYGLHMGGFVSTIPTILVSGVAILSLIDGLTRY